MTKSEAAEYLEVSERTLERYAKQGRLHPAQRRGATRPVLEYDADELARLKSELAAPTGATNADTTNSDNASETAPTTLATVPKSAVGISGRQKTTIATRQKPTGFDGASMDALQVLAAMVESSGQPVQETAAKLLLKLDEAALLTGLSRQILRAAIGDGTLKASQIGRAWRVKRSDLDAYIEAL